MPQLHAPIIVLAGAVITMAAGAADASNCYVILDAKETIVYRASMPPVDMSDRGAAAREALRQRGNYLLFMDTEQCVPMGFDSGDVISRQRNTGSITAVDEGAVARAPGIQTARPTAGTPAARSAPGIPRRNVQHRIEVGDHLSCGLSARAFASTSRTSAGQELLLTHCFVGWRTRDSNPGPKDYDSSALTS